MNNMKVRLNIRSSQGNLPLDLVATSVKFIGGKFRIVHKSGTKTMTVRPDQLVSMSIIPNTEEQ